MPFESRAMLRSRANTIEGGTTEVNKNIVAERVLGLPREPDPYVDVAWEDVPRRDRSPSLASLLIGSPFPADEPLLHGPDSTLTAAEARAAAQAVATGCTARVAARAPPSRCRSAMGRS